MSRRRAWSSFHYHPIEVALGVVVATCFSFAVHDSRLVSLVLTVFFPAILVWLAVYTTSCLHALGALSTKARVGLTVGCLIIGAGYAGWFFELSLYGHRWQWFLLFTALSAALMVTPLLGKGYAASAEARFLQFSSRLIIRLAICGVWLGALYLAAGWGLAALTSLFPISDPHVWHGHLVGWLFACIGPWMLVAGTRNMVRVDDPIPEAAWRGIAALGPVLVLPLVILLVVLPLSSLVILERIDQSGWTELLYIQLVARACFFVLCIYTGLQLIRREAVRFSRIPVVIAIASLLALMGPWSATEVSKRSQLNRMTAAADAAGILRSDGTIVQEAFKDGNSREHKRSIVESARYLRSHHGEDSYKHLARDGEEIVMHWKFFY